MAQILKKHRSSRHSQHGQVLIFALIALVALMIATLFLFDVHTVIRGKVKGQSAVDSAALTGAIWQMNALNIIGEINLIKATTVLTDEGIFGMNQDDSMGIQVITQMAPAEAYYSIDRNGNCYFDESEFRKDVNQVIEDFARLDDAMQMLTQMQVRVGFVLPLLGYGAAQQAAKNNGVTVNEDVQAMLEDMYSDINDASMYGDPNLAPQNLYGYMWRQSYGDMIQALYQSGVAVGTAVERLGSPTVSGMFPYLNNKDFYSAILARNWCHLKDVLKESFSGSWWGKFDAYANASFSGQSELLPLHIEYVEGGHSYLPIREIFPKRYSDNSVLPLSDLYDQSNPYPGIIYKDQTSGKWLINENLMKQYANQGYPTPPGMSETDYRFNIFPELVWATYGSEWYGYSDDFKREWGEYLRSDFKDGYDYQSGAVAYFAMRQPTKTLTANFSDSDSGRTGDLGKPFDYNREASKDISTAQRNLSNGVHQIETDAVGKPFGRVKLYDGSYKSPLYPARVVLPVFTDVGLIPVTMETVYGDSQTDRNWIRFLVEYLPVLGDSSSLEDAWIKVVAKYPDHAHIFASYHYALTLIDNPDFRQTGIDWLKEYSDRCDYWPSGGSGSRRGPGKIH